MKIIYPYIISGLKIILTLTTDIMTLRRKKKRVAKETAAISRVLSGAVLSDACEWE